MVLSPSVLSPSHSHSLSLSPTPCKVPLSLISHLSFSFKACTRVGLGLWFDLGMVVGWDRLMVGLDQRGFGGLGVLEIALMALMGLTEV